MAICIYPPNADDFATNGLGVLTPTECTISEEACGMFELELKQPIDETLRWAQLEPGCIIKAPVPTRESPLYEEVEDVWGELPVKVTRNVWVVSGTTVGLYMRSGPGTKYKKYGYLKNGAKVNEIGRQTVSGRVWVHVIVQKGGRNCWMSTKWLKRSGTVTETLSQGKIIGQRTISYEQSREQLFRIYSVERDAKKQIVTAKAMHVYYDLRANLVNKKYEAKKADAKTALSTVFGALQAPTDFELHVAAGVSGKVSGDYGWKNPVECMLDPDEGILPQAKATLVRDNFDVFVLPDFTRDSGVTIRRGKNLLGVTVTQDASDIVTRIIPCGKNKKGEELFLSGTNYIDSPHINDYPIPYVKKIDYDAKTVDKDADNETTFRNDTATRAKIRALAEADFSENGVDLPTYGMKVDFVLLQNTAEYAEYAALQAVFLNDTVTVIDSMIGLRASVRVTGYEWSALTQQYESVTLGEIEKLDQTVYSYNLPTAGISGSKIAPNSASGDILRDLSVQYAKIATAAIELLNADAINALSAYIGELTAETIQTDELSANMAHIFQLLVDQVVADSIHAGSITADTLMASLLKAFEVSAQLGDFDFATVQHLVASALNIQEAAVAGKVLIENLSVNYAQMVNAAIGNLVVQAEDGGYYKLNVSSDGTVSAQRVALTDSELENGQTSDGRIILGTEITADNLTTANLLATFALVNKIDAARIDVDELFANKAFLAHLFTTDISSNTTVQIVTRMANDAAAAAAAAMEAAGVVESDVNDGLRRLLRFFTFDSDEGLTVALNDENGQPVGIWSTLIDEIGFHVRRRDQAEYVFSVYRDRCRVRNLEIGNIAVKASSKGGHVWVHA